MRSLKKCFAAKQTFSSGRGTSLNESIAIATDEGDNTSRELFEKILIDEEEHVDWLEAQLGMIDQMGLGIYLSEQMRE